MEYRILGGGPAGLSAAITLAKAGYDVVVFERRRQCGARFGGDLQGIENWSTSTDALDELREYGITPDFYCAPMSRAVHTNGRIDVSMSFAGAGLYLVKRGTASDSLDQSLARQATAAGARIRFGETIDPSAAHIAATGPRGHSIFAIDRGIVFETDAPDCAIVLTDDRAAPKGYAYVLVTNGYGCLCTMLFTDFPSVHARLAYSRALLESRYSIAIRNPRPVGGVGAFAARASYQDGATLMAGEAAGLQDFLWGFGIRTAIRSGVAAATCLMEHGDWEATATRRFGRPLRASVVNRCLFEVLRHGRYLALMAIFKAGGPRALLHSFAGLNRMQRMMYPIARAYTRRVYPNLEV